MAVGGVSSLQKKLRQFTVSLTDAEKSNYKYLLGMAAGGLAPNGVTPSSGMSRTAFAATVNALADLQPHAHYIPASGIVYRGRPEFVTVDVLNALQREAIELRASATRFDDHFVASNGRCARHIALSTDLNNLLRRYTSPVSATAKANYLYYDDPGQGIDPHIDGPDFSLNAILMLRHKYETHPSALIVYDAEGKSERVHLHPGEMIVLFADSTTHARERMKANEALTIAAFGFHSLR